MLHGEFKKKKKKAKQARFFVIQMDTCARLPVQLGHTDGVSLKSPRISGSHTSVSSTRRSDGGSDYGASDILLLKANDKAGHSAARQDTDLVHSRGIQSEITARADD